MKRLVRSDCLKYMRKIDSSSVDTIITDPPYALQFMGKDWDKVLPGVEYWEEILRVAKPGAFLLSFGGTRTFHRLTCNIEDAGWEIRDCIMWVYASGFPKSHDISKAIDKGKGHWRGKAGKIKSANTSMTAPNYERTPKGKGVTRDAQTWDGWGTALKPAWEPIIVAMKPLEGTFAQNALEQGVAGLSIDEGRIGTTKSIPHSPSGNKSTRCLGVYKPKDGTASGFNRNIGRWPANLIHDGSEEVTRLFPSPHGAGQARKSSEGSHNGPCGLFGIGEPAMRFGDSGSAARFFYCAKAAKSERGKANSHPTVKPLKLMEYLCNLTRTPTGGVVLDPFMGSGTTCLACVNVKRGFIGIEKDKDSFRIAVSRVKGAK